jgi:trehalose 6-phosphate phosphatase
MIGILTRHGVEAIERAVAGRPLLAFDFDGTLAPLVEQPSAARMKTSTHTLLRAIARSFTVAVVSGRSRPDLISRLEGIPAVALVGNHGAETGQGPPDPRVRRRVAAWAKTLESVFASARGVEVEDKGLTLSLHYRRAPEPEEARRRLFAAASAFPDARLTGGHAVLNLIPRELPTKGSAVEKLVSGFGCTSALFVGDDVTDEDAFESPVVQVPVRVGPDPGSAARYFLEGQDQVDTLLEVLLAAKAQRS